MVIKKEAYLQRRTNVVLPAAFDGRAVVTSATGCFLYDSNGKRYTDFSSGLGQSNLGHGHPILHEALENTAKTLSSAPGLGMDYCLNIPWDGTTHEVSLAALGEVINIVMPNPSGWRIFPSSGGADANNVAVELLIRLHRGQKKKFIAFHNSFHGRRGPAQDLTSSKAVHDEFSGGWIQVHHIHFPCYDAMNGELHPSSVTWQQENGFALKDFLEHLDRDFSKEDAAGLWFEIIQGEGGVNMPDERELGAIISFCQESGIPAIDDEVQLGFGRTGSMFAFETLRVQPDIVCLAKSISNGLVASGLTAVSKKLIPDALLKERIKQGWNAGTFYGNPVSVALALAVLYVFQKENVLSRAKHSGEIMKQYLAEMRERLVRKYGERISKPRGRGMMRAFTLQKEDGHLNPELRNTLVRKLAENGVWVWGCGHSSVRLMPPLIIAENHLVNGMELVEKSIAEVLS